MKAEALKWENKRLAQAKAKLEAQLRDQQRRLVHLEEIVADLKAPCKRASSKGPPSSPRVGDRFFFSMICSFAATLYISMKTGHSLLAALELNRIVKHTLSSATGIPPADPG